MRLKAEQALKKAASAGPLSLHEAALFWEIF
jgi:hypothetical protein